MFEGDGAEVPYILRDEAIGLLSYLSCTHRVVIIVPGVFADDEEKAWADQLEGVGGDVVGTKMNSNQLSMD